MAVNIGPRIGIDGEKEYRAQIQNIIQQAKTLDSEMKAVAASFTSSTSAEEKAAKTASIHAQQLKVQQDRVAALKDGLAKAAKEFGEADTRTLKWKQAVNEATAELNRMEAETDDVTASTHKMGDSLENAGEKTSRFAEKLKSGLVASAKIAAAAVTATATAVGILAKNALEGYGDYEQLVGGVETLFKESSDQIMGYAENAYKTAGLSANQYMETVTGFAASLIQSVGGDTAKAAKMADTAITDMADNANKMGTEMASIQNAYQGFAKQNYTMLDNLKLGYGGTKEEMERLLADAEKLSGIKYDISSYADIVQAIHEVQNEMGITGTTAKEASETIQGSVSAAKSAWENLVAGLGNENADISGLVKNFSDSILTAGKNIVPRIEQILKGIGEAIKGISPIIGEIVPAILTNILPQLVSAGTQLLVSISDGIISAMPQLLETGKNAFDKMIVYLRENLPQFISTGLDAILSFSSGLREGVGDLVDSAIVMIQTIADGLIAALPDLISKVPLIVSNIAGVINDNAPKLIATGLELIVKLVKGLIENIPVILENMPKIIKAIWDTITAINWIKLGATILTGIVNGIKSMGGALLNAVKGILQHPINFIKGLFSSFMDMGRQLIRFFSSGISGMIGSVASAMSSIRIAIWNAITGLLSSAIGWGRDMISGFADGILGGIRLVTDAVKSIADRVTSFLHFSRPDVGPLRDYETWMPDFMKGLSDGIRANTWRVQDAVSNLASGMELPPIQTTMAAMQPATAMTGTGNLGGGITLNVYGAPGQDVNQLADIVMSKIESVTRRREAVY